MKAADVPLVSVLMTAFRPNNDYLYEAIESVLDQTLEDLELVIVEDPSDSPARLSGKHASDPRVRHITNSQRTSHVEQRNQSVREARGTFLAVLDADDIWEREKLTVQVAFMRANPTISVVGTFVSVIDGDGRPCGGRTYPTVPGRILEAMRRFNPLCHSSVLLRKEALANVGGYQFRGPGHDYELWCRMARSGFHFANCRRRLVRYRIHDAQIKTTYVRESLANTILIKAMHWRNESSSMNRGWLMLEKILLRLPPTVVIGLVKWFHYSGDLPWTRKTRKH